MPSALKVSHLEKSFAKIKAVEDLSLDVEPGEVLGIIGPNGAGKTTTIKMILGLLQPDRGEIELLGGRIEQQIVRERLGYMPETPSFFAHLSGRELLTFVGSLFPLSQAEVKKRSQKLLEEVDLAEAADRHLSTYSKGMLQRICLAQALINNPDLLLLDEPFDGLDPIGRIRMKEVLLSIRQRGTAIIFNSHILSDVEVMSDRIAIMDHGRLLKWEKVKTLLTPGQSLEDLFFKTIAHV